MASTQPRQGFNKASRVRPAARVPRRKSPAGTDPVCEGRAHCSLLAAGSTDSVRAQALPVSVRFPVTSTNGN